MYYLTDNKEMLGFSSLANYPDIFNFTTTRRGGVSKGNYGSLNCSPFTGDDADAIRQNWAIIEGLLPIAPIEVVMPYQTHGSNVLLVDKAFIQLSEQEREKVLYGVDAVVTKHPKVLLTIATADCVPITFYDVKQQVVALAHAGWRGTVAKVAEKVVTKMVDEYGSNPKDIQVGIGPSISLEAFEVGHEVVDNFKNAGFDVAYIATKNAESEKYHIDLWKANSWVLTGCGIPIENISVAAICTYTSHDEFFSARRLGIKSGRITTGIMII